MAAAANYHFARQCLLEAVERGHGSAWALTGRGGSALMDGNLLWLSLTTVAGSALLVIAAFLLVRLVRSRSKTVGVKADDSPTRLPATISPAGSPDITREVDRRIRELERTNEQLRREVAERQQVEEALKLRGRYITAVAQIEQALLSHGEPHDWGDTILAILGEVSGASRCYLYR
ncbi:MAG: hypothetical protein OEW00_09895, partial [candidate division Zixibacteria bacterium]|nr:hypothetical protein [candidate division Zixibacteria bacterium]